MDFAANIERFTGFADHYDRYRPSPPEALAGLLGQFLGQERPRLVVDLGCGSGLSTRHWSARADAVIGVDPTDAMLAQARSMRLRVSSIERDSPMRQGSRKPVRIS